MRQLSQRYVVSFLSQRPLNRLDLWHLFVGFNGCSTGYVLRYFMVGCGALGCEFLGERNRLGLWAASIPGLLRLRFLKNFALNGVCCGPDGLLTVRSLRMCSRIGRSSGHESNLAEKLCHVAYALPTFFKSLAPEEGIMRTKIVSSIGHMASQESEFFVL